MPSIHTLVLFAGTVAAFLLIPGPAVIYIVTRSASQGRRAGLVSVAGIHLGTLVHVAAAVAGLSAVLVASAAAFTVVKLAGAAYLIQLGVRTLLHSGHRAADVPVAAPVGDVPVDAAPVASGGGQGRTLRRALADGAVVNVLNPKTAVFFLAFVPQFVEVGAARPAVQLLSLSAVFLVLGVLFDSAYAVLGGTVVRRLSRSTGAAHLGARATGTAYIGLGLVTALSGGHRD